MSPSRVFSFASVSLRVGSTVFLDFELRASSSCISTIVLWQWNFSFLVGILFRIRVFRVTTGNCLIAHTAFQSERAMRPLSTLPTRSPHLPITAEMALFPDSKMAVSSCFSSSHVSDCVETKAALTLGGHTNAKLSRPLCLSHAWA